MLRGYKAILGAGEANGESSAIVRLGGRQNIPPNAAVSMFGWGKFNTKQP